jgi:vacuolar-type H+-ATPase subunit C/Vma6
MNQILAGIYGTHGHEKVASEGGHAIATLSDLALALVVEQMPEGSDLEKVASAQAPVLEELEYYDLAGRAAAHSEFSEMEKAASEGNWGPLEAFFEEQVEQGDEVHSDAAALKQAVLSELQRRVQG